MTNDAGFTLLELLISMTLLALLSLLLFGGLRFGARAWERSEAHSTGMDEVRVVQGLLRHEIEQAYPLFVTADPVNPFVDFSGSEAGMNFLAPAPQAMSGVGRARIVLEREADGRNVQLVMRARSELSRQDSNTREEPLLRNLASVRFAYFGADAPGAVPVWHDRWANVQTMPDLVRVDVKFLKGDARVWPELVVATQILVDANCTYDFMTKHCQGRR